MLVSFPTNVHKLLSTKEIQDMVVLARNGQKPSKIRKLTR